MRKQCVNNLRATGDKSLLTRKQRRLRIAHLNREDMMPSAMADDPSSPISFRMPASYVEQLAIRAKAKGLKPSEYVRELVIEDLTEEGEASLEEQNAEALKAIRRLANLLRGDMATLANVLLIEAAKWDREKARNWIEKTFHHPT